MNEQSYNIRHTSENNDGYDKWRYTIYTTMIFLFIVNPYTYKASNLLLGNFVNTCSSNGCPTYIGILLHAVIFTLLIRYIMEFNI
jgi:hypothetical protein